MPKRIIPLSEMKVQKAKPQESHTNYLMEAVLYLLVTPSGGKFGVSNITSTIKKRNLLSDHILKLAY
jgi:hypothetical protein